ncbi:MAG: hypothetical protein M3O70_06305 [Actinomycetota bacterium]|nr:hypothetical protein [Actinomycetota bacterium]
MVVRERLGRLFGSRNGDDFDMVDQVIDQSTPSNAIVEDAKANQSRMIRRRTPRPSKTQMPRHAACGR